MKLFGNDIQFGTILEVFMLFFGLYHISKTSKDSEDIENQINNLAKDSKYGPLVKAAGGFIKINKKGWDDEVLYDEALGEIDPEARFTWFRLIYNIAVNKPDLFDKFVNYLAHLPKERRIAVLKEILESCDDEESLIKVITARSAHDPNASGLSFIKIMRKFFIEAGKAGDGIKTATEKLSTATGEAFTAMNDEAVESDSVGKAQNFKERMKQKYEKKGV